MICSRCGKPVIELFYSRECPCPPLPERGFVLLASTTVLPQLQHVFPDEVEARAWRAAHGLEALEIREVRSSGFLFSRRSGGETATKRPWIIYSQPSKAGDDGAWIA